MANNSGSAALGIGAVGAGALFIYAAFSKKPLFGANGLIRTFIGTGSAEAAGKSAAQALKDVAHAVNNIGNVAGGATSGIGSALGGIAPNLKPPGA